MEIPSTHAGVVKELRVKLGDKVGWGSTGADDEGVAGAAASAAGRRNLRQRPAQARAGRGARTGHGRNGVDVVVPDIGDFDEVAVIEVLIKPGDTITAEQSLVTVESDKASMEIPSSHAGVVKEVRVKLGDKVKKGSLLAVIEASSGSRAGRAAAGARGSGTGAGRTGSKRGAPAHRPRPLPPCLRTNPGAARGALPHASPTIRKLARELGFRSMK